MDIGLSIADGLTAVIALLSLWLSVIALHRTKGNDLFQLRQRVRMEAERARSAWYELGHECNTLIHRVRIDPTLVPSHRARLFEFLTDHREHLDQCILDAIALAEDVHAKADELSEEKCRHYLRMIEPSVEKLSRNRGVAERKLAEFMAQLAASSQSKA